MLLFIWRGLYDFPLKRTTIVVGSISLVVALTYLIIILVTNLSYVAEASVAVIFDSPGSLAFGCINALLYASLSALIILAAVKAQRFLLLPYMVYTCIAIIMNIYWMAMFVQYDDSYRSSILYFSVLFLQIKAGFVAGRHFQELTIVEKELSAVNDSQSPYGKMANSVT